MYKFAICDDEPRYISEIKALLEEFLSSKKIRNYIIITFENGTSLLNSEEQFNLIFLDILLTDMNGNQIAEKFMKQSRRENIVFVSNSELGKTQGYRVNALRYITKPINREELFFDLEYLLKKIISDNLFLYDESMQNYRIFYKDILYIEVLGRYTSIHLEHQVRRFRKQLVEWESILKNQHFTKCHKSLLVNLRLVEDIDKDQIILKNKERL